MEVHGYNSANKKEAAANDPDARIFELTAPQTSIWIDQSLHSGKPIYNTGQIISISGHIDVTRFAEALRQVVSENDALRLRLFQKGPRVFQEIVPYTETPLNYRDFVGSSDPEGAASAWIESTFWKPLRPTDFPLFEFALAKIAPDRFIWLQKYHHLIIDATGRQIVTARTAAIYNASSNHEEPVEITAPSFRTAKAVEGEYLASPQYAADEVYWTNRFRDLPPSFIEADTRLSERSRSGRPTRRDFEITLDASIELRAFARCHNSSVFKVILCLVWSCLANLYRNTDLIIGVPVANRRTSAAKSCVGLFSKMMPFRLFLDPVKPFSAALSEIGEYFSKDIQHHLFPLDHIVRTLDLRGKGQSGLFHVAVNYVRNDYNLMFGKAPVTCTNLSSGFSVALAVTAFDHGEKEPIRIVLDGDPGRISPDDLTALFGCLQRLLLTASDVHDLPVGELSQDLRAIEPVSCQDPDFPTPIGTPKQPAEIAAEPCGDEIEATLLGIWRDCLQAPSATVSSNYFDLGGNSLKAIELIGRCNEVFVMDLPISALFEFPTVVEMAKTIRAAGVAAPRATLVQLRSGRAGTPCVLVHAIGGTLFCYNELISGLKGDYSVYGLQAPDLASGEFFPDSVEDIARNYVNALERITGDTPCHFAGWSFGGVVAFEMACQWYSKTRRFSGLTLIDTPCRPGFWEGNEDETILASAARLLGVGAYVGPITNGAASVSKIILSAAARTGTPIPSEEHVEGIIKLIRNVRRARLKYRPPRLPGEATSFRAAGEPNVREEEFDWINYVEGRLNVFRLDATHESILALPHAQKIAAHLDTVCGMDAGA